MKKRSGKRGVKQAIYSKKIALIIAIFAAVFISFFLLTKWQPGILPSPPEESNETCVEGDFRQCSLENLNLTGVCLSFSANESCVNSSWTGCFYDFSVLPDYEANETKCDLLDNDCNGLVDESQNCREAVCGDDTCEGGKGENCAYCSLDCGRCSEISEGIEIINPDDNSTIPLGVFNTTVEIETDEDSECRYSTREGFNFLLGRLFEETGERTHSFFLSNFTLGGNYTFYYKCFDGSQILYAEHFFNVEKPFTGPVNITPVPEPPRTVEIVGGTRGTFDGLILIGKGADANAITASIQRVLKPSGVRDASDSSEALLRYVDLKLGGIERQDIVSLEVFFSVEKKDLSSGGNIALKVYNENESKWIRLDTALVGEDENFFELSSNSSKTGLFAVVTKISDVKSDALRTISCGDKSCQQYESCSSCSADCGECPAPVAVCGNNVPENGETCRNCPNDIICSSGEYCSDAGVCTERRFPIFALTIPLIILALAAIIFFSYKMLLQRKTASEAENLGELVSYIKESIQAGESEEAVKTNTLEAGWTEKDFKNALKKAKKSLL